MNELLGDCLFPIILGSNTAGHACVRRMEQRYGVGSTVLTGKRALTLRFLPSVRVLFAPPTLHDEVLLSILRDLDGESGLRLPLLVACDAAYDGFLARNAQELEAHFILRRANDLLGVGDGI
ncbi:MAG: hypothetical protein IJC99_00305 [Clostridia bacterium]|nr:hypothetical protein [Clostridia bacterium]